MRVVFVDNILIDRADAENAIELQPHLGLIGLIAAVRVAGHDGVLYDPKIDIARKIARLGSGFYATIADRIASLEPDVVGFTALGCNFASIVKIAAALRALRPQTAIALGGPHASILDRAILERYPVFDAIVRGEADATIVAFVEALGGGGALADVRGVSYRTAGEIVRTPDAEAILDLDALPFPAYDAYPIRELGLAVLRVDAGRGCPFHCSFCSTATFFGRRYRLKSSARLVAELDRLAHEYGIRSFTLNHDLFTVNAKKVREFCVAVADRGYAWSCSARMDCVDDGLLAEMAAAGCDAIYYGVETGSRRLQRVVEKNLDLELYHPRVATSLELGMLVTVSFITGYPNETLADQDETLALCGESIERYGRELDIQLHMLTPEPGTALFNEFHERLAYDGHITDFTFPAIEADDASLARDDPQNFVCHHYYASGIARATNIAAVEGYSGLYALDRSVLRALARAYDGSFVELVRAYGAYLGETRLPPGRALTGFVDARFGEAHPLAETIRYIVAVSELRVETRASAFAPSGDRSIALARNVRPLGCVREGRVAIEALRAGSHASELDALPRAHRLLVAATDVLSYQSFIVDALATEVVGALATPTALAALRRRFAARGADIDALVSTLALLGAVVYATEPGEPDLRLRRADDEIEGDAQALGVGGRPNV